MQQYLSASKYIDLDDREVSSVAKDLARSTTSEHELIRLCFEFVRDEIRHSADFKLNPVTSRASDVLRHKTGYSGTPDVTHAVRSASRRCQQAWQSKLKRLSRLRKHRVNPHH